MRLGGLGAGLPQIICGLDGVSSQFGKWLSGIYSTSFTATSGTAGSRKSQITL